MESHIARNAVRPTPLCYSTDPAERRERVAMFDSTDLFDHTTARRLCAGCPIREQCRRLSREIAVFGRWAGAPQGTWGGELWRAGQLIRGTDRLTA